MATVTLTGDWDEFEQALAEAPRKIPKAIKKAILKETHHLRKLMLGPEGIKNPSMTPLSGLTRALSGRSRPLHASGALRNSIGVIRISGGAFVGVRRSAKAGGKMGSVNLAMLHENGSTQIVTVKQSKFFMAIGIEMFGKPIIKKPGSRIRIPARPFISPVLDKHATAEVIGPRLLEQFAAEMGPPWVIK